MVTWDTGLFRTAGYLWFKGLLIHCLFRIARLALIETALGLLSRNRSIHPTRHQASGIRNLIFIFVGRDKSTHRKGLFNDFRCYLDGHSLPALYAQRCYHSEISYQTCENGGCFRRAGIVHYVHDTFTYVHIWHYHFLSKRPPT